MQNSAVERTLCHTCRTIDFDGLLLRGSKAHPPMRTLGKLPDLCKRSQDCCFCQFLVEEIHSAQRQASGSDYHPSPTVSIIRSRRGWAAPRQDPEADDERQELYLLHVFFGPAIGLVPCIVPVPSVRTYWESPCTFPDRGGSSFSGRLIEPIVDIRLPKKWLELCETSHADRCEHPSWLGANEYPQSLRLVNVHQMCLEEDVPRCRYVCLSYVWGAECLNFRATVANVVSLRRKGGLAKQALPRTILDACSFVRDMGESYLWVDSLCIVQDDDYDTSVHIAQMDLIYSRALLTVVAGTGADCNAGLAHLYRQIRTPAQSVVQVSERLALMHDHAAQSDSSRHHRASPWASRGWTYQELQLSRRALLIFEDMLHWKCECGYWNENSCFEPGPSENLGLSPVELRDHRHLGVLLGARFDMRNLDTHIANYNFDRDFSKESDILIAFHGILRRMELVSGSQFYWGMPRDSFSLWLLWADNCLLGRRESASRRQSMCSLPGTQNGATRSVPFPSWSWLGWYTHTDFPNTRYAATRVTGPSPRYLVWAAQWLSIDSSGATSPVEVMHADHRARPTWSDSPAWTGESLVPDCEPFGKEWLDSGRIAARTSCARLRIRTLILDMAARMAGRLPNDSRLYSLLDEEMNVLGETAMECRDHALPIVNGSEEEFLEEQNQGRLRDFIVLSRELRRIDSDGWSSEDESSPGVQDDGSSDDESPPKAQDDDVSRDEGYTNHLNLMMVEWDPSEPGVARRLGIFEMPEEYWMKCDHEWKCVTLA